jgi:HD-like signal output (HDOD) protein/ActR/RegA family two-component response regulator
LRRILFVAEEPRVLNAHRDRMQKYSSQMDTMFALGGPAALEAVQKAAIDAVVCDMRIQAPDGAVLLGTLKEDHPDIVRITLCSPSEIDSIFAALPVSHQILAKPLDPDALCNVIERTFRLHALLTDSLRKLIGSVEQLPSVPAVYRELISAMSRPDISAQKVARIIEKDAAMAAKTLQLVNSACFALKRTVTSVDQAVAHLGMDLIKNLSLTVHVFAALERTALRLGFSFDAEQDHSVLTARVAKRLVSNRRQAQDVFTAALLHDIGNLVLAVCIPEKFKKAFLASQASGRPSHEVEAELLGVTHAEVGAYLLGLWGLPYPIVEAVAYHHNPAAALERTFDLPSAVSVANALVEEAMGGKPIAITEHLESLQVLHKLPRWREIAAQELQQVSPQSVA